MSSIGDVLRPSTSINLLHHKFNIVWAVHLTRTCHLGGSCPLFSITSHKRTCYLDGSCHLLAQCRIRTSPRCRRPRSLQLRALNAYLHVFRECQTGIQRVYVPVSGKLCVIYTNSQQRIQQARSYMYAYVLHRSASARYFLMVVSCAICTRFKLRMSSYRRRQAEDCATRCSRR